MNFTDTYEQLTTIETELPPAITEPDGSIITLYFKPFLAELKKRVPRTVKTASLLEFFNSLGKNKSGSNNGIGRCQEFCNAFSEEYALQQLNPNCLKFINDDHDFLTRGNHGTDAAEFWFTTRSGEKFKLEAKIYFDEQSYFENGVDYGNFHDADYVIVYLIRYKVWAFSRKLDGYKKLSTRDMFKDTDPWLYELKLPKSLETISFYIPGSSKPLRDYFDEELPEEVTYNFFTNQIKDI